MDGRFSSTLSSGHDISSTLCLTNMEVSDVILMIGPLVLVLLLSLGLLESTEIFLFASVEILNYTKSCTHVDNLIVGLTKVEARGVSVSCIPIDMVYFVGHCWSLLETSGLGSLRDRFVDSF